MFLNLRYFTIDKNYVIELLFFVFSALLNFNNAPITTANVGISSLYNEGRRLLLAEAILITAHEIGKKYVDLGFKFLIPKETKHLTSYMYFTDRFLVICLALKLLTFLKIFLLT